MYQKDLTAENLRREFHLAREQGENPNTLATLERMAEGFEKFEALERAAKERGVIITSEVLQ